VTFVELCCGTAGVSQYVVGGWRLRALTAYQGGKIRYASAILAALGAWDRPDRLVLCDAGPWARVWQTLLVDHRWGDVQGHLAELARGQLQGAALFQSLATCPPPADSAKWAATFLALQSASARGRPITYRPDSWRTAGYAHLSKAAVAKGFRDRLRPGLLARRVRALSGLGWPPTTVMHCGADDVPVQADAVVYIDPPYEGTTGYADDLPRGQLLDLAKRWATAGAVVAISEAEPLPLAGWHHLAIEPARRTMGQHARHSTEWLTINRPPRGQASLGLS